ncbi:MAG: IclR family transcriptional regulator [Actinopolymorphaceae bacterium]
MPPDTSATVTGEIAMALRRTSIQAIDRSVAMLDGIAQAGPGGIALKTLSGTLGLHASTARTLLASLVTHGLLRQDEGTRHYFLGPRFFELNRIYLAQTDLSSAASPILRDLWERTNETVHLATLKDTQRVDIAVLVSRQLLNINPTTAQFTDEVAVPLYRTAAGKVLFAGLSDDSRERMLVTAPWQGDGRSPHTPEDLAALVADVRTKGYAINDEEDAPGVCGVAAPVRDHTGRTVAAVCIGYPTVRHTPAHDESLRTAVIRAADELSALLGAPHQQSAKDAG